MSHFSCGLSAIPDYLKAADLMEKFPELLQETDSILDAVKKICGQPSGRTACH